MDETTEIEQADTETKTIEEPTKPRVRQPRRMPTPPMKQIQGLKKSFLKYVKENEGTEEGKRWVIEETIDEKCSSGRCGFPPIYTPKQVDI